MNHITQTIAIALDPYVVYMTLLSPLIELWCQVPLALLDSKLSFIVWPPERQGPILKPTPPDPKAKRGPAWRKEVNDVERARRREARVTIASSST